MYRFYYLGRIDILNTIFFHCFMNWYVNVLRGKKGSRHRLGDICFKQFLWRHETKTHFQRQTDIAESVFS